MRTRTRGVPVAVTALVLSGIATATALLSCDKKAPTEPVHTYTLTAQTQPPASAEVGGPVSPDPSVLVMLDGKPAAGVTVQWTAGEGGSVQPASSGTNASGLASTRWTLGGTAGAQHLTASALSLAPVPFLTTATPGPLAKLVLAQDAVVLADIGDTLTLRVNATDRFNNALPTPALTWTSLHASIASVTAAGHVRGLTAGTARVVVASAGMTDTATVEVRRPARSIAVTPRSLSLRALTATAPLSAVVKDRRDEVISGAAVAWQSADTSVAYVSVAGVVTARKNGATIVYARADSLRDSVSVVVQQVATRITMTSAATWMSIGDSVQFRASPVDSLEQELPDSAVTWTSTNSGVALAKPGGWVVGLGAGRTEIVASSGTLSARATLDVYRRAVSVTVEPAAATIQVGQAIQLAGTARDAQAQATPVPLVWRSSDSAVAKLNPAPAVMGVAIGTATIRAQVQNAPALFAEARITVVAPSAASIKIETPAGNLDYVGAKVRLTARIWDAAGNAMPWLTPTWSALDTAIATIDASGMVTQVSGRPSARFVARYGSLVDTIQLKVWQRIATFRATPRTLNLALLNAPFVDSAFVRFSAWDAGGTAAPIMALFNQAQSGGIVRISPVHSAIPNQGAFDGAWIIARVVGSSLFKFSGEMDSISGGLGAMDTVRVNITSDLSGVDGVPPTGLQMRTGTTVHLTVQGYDRRGNKILVQTGYSPGLFVKQSTVGTLAVLDISAVLPGTYSMTFRADTYTTTMSVRVTF